jgi:hypothetical protein
MPALRRVASVALLALLAALVPQSPATAQGVVSVFQSGFIAPAGVATDLSGDVFVSASGTFRAQIDKFDATGVFLGGIDLGTGVESFGSLALDPVTGDMYHLA